MDGRLREDLNHLAKITGSNSTNDLIVTLLLEYVEREDVKDRLEKYREMLGAVSN